jgi:hypothetical protein
LRDAQAAARTMGLQVQVLNAGTSREINAAFETFVRERPDLLLVGLDVYLNSRRAKLTNWALGLTVPPTLLAILRRKPARAHSGRAARHSSPIPKLVYRRDFVRG